MGEPMCANLVKAGYRVVATDVRPERAEVALACGAVWSPDAAETARTADVLITMLPGPAEVAQAMHDVIDALPAGATWIDMSSNAPAAARPVGELAAARGIDVLEAPVGGGPAAARDGTLKLYVGGGTTVFARCRPILDVLGTPEHLGGHGAGYTTKLIINLLWFGQAVATAEALLLGRRAGLDLRTLHRTLAGSAAASDFVNRDLPSLFAGDYLTSFGLDRICEELAALTTMAGEQQVPFELSELVERTYRRALARYGPVDGELLAVALLEEQAGQRLRTG
jgi:3-hydroxyisobutyrate dehydrogenase